MTKTDDEIIDELNKKGIIGLTSSYKEAISKARQSGRQSAQTEFEKLIDECACGKNDREWISIEELKSKLKSATTKEEKEKI